MNYISKVINSVLCAKRRRNENLRYRGWSLHEYLDEDGNFDYSQYKMVQVKANKNKINCVWVQEENIEFLSGYIKDRISDIRLGLCHGTRQGLEQKWFKEKLSCEMIGTEISDTAINYPNTIQWDFHDVKPEWISSVDFIYSNSLDHSYNPEKCLNAWVSCLTDDGIIILEHSVDDVKSKETDPFGAELCMMPYLILKWSKGGYAIIDILEAPKKSKFKNNEYMTYFLVIKKQNSIQKNKIFLAQSIKS